MINGRWFSAALPFTPSVFCFAKFSSLSEGAVKAFILEEGGSRKLTEGVYSITYDAIGNPTSYRGAAMTWNGRKLMSYNKSGKSISYKYDGNGLRTQKTVNGVQHDYYYVDGQIAYEKVGNDYSLYYRYDQDGRLSMVIKNRLSDNYKWYFYLLSNTRGDIVAMNDAAGPLTVKYNYDAWGKVLSVTNAAGTQHTAGNFAHQIPVRYRGYYYDEEIGLYYLQSRYYDPETGRFLNADDAEYIGYSGGQLSYNAFAYCENNAVNCVDISGFYAYNLNTKSVNSDEPPDHPDFKPPKKGSKKVKNPNGNGRGWVDEDGGVWVWDEKMHGGKGWTVQYPNGKHKHAYPGGKVRSHFETQQPSKENIIIAVILVAIILVLVADNCTMLGVVDDAAIPALVSCYFNLNSTKMVCTVCGEVIYV